METLHATEFLMWEEAILPIKLTPPINVKNFK